MSDPSESVRMLTAVARHIPLGVCRMNRLWCAPFLLAYSCCFLGELANDFRIIHVSY